MGAGGGLGLERKRQPMQTDRGDLGGFLGMSLESAQKGGERRLGGIGGEMSFEAWGRGEVVICSISVGRGRRVWEPFHGSSWSNTKFKKT